MPSSQLEQDPERIRLANQRTATTTSTTTTSAPVASPPPSPTVPTVPLPSSYPEDVGLRTASTSPIYKAPAPTSAPVPAPVPAPKPVTQTAPKTSTPTQDVGLKTLIQSTVYNPPTPTTTTPPKPAPAEDVALKTLSQSTVYNPPKPPAAAPTPDPASEDVGLKTLSQSPVYNPTPAPAPKPVEDAALRNLVSNPTMNPPRQAEDVALKTLVQSPIYNPPRQAEDVGLKTLVQSPVYNPTPAQMQKMEGFKSGAPTVSPPYVIPREQMPTGPQFQLNELDPLERAQFEATPGSAKYWASVTPEEYTEAIKQGNPVAGAILIAGGFYFAPLFLPISATALVASTGIGVAISEGTSYVTTGKWIDKPEEIMNIALQAEFLTMLGVGTLAGVGRVAPAVAKSVFGRAGVNALLGAGTSYVASGGNLEETAKGAVLGGGISLGVELVAMPLINKARGYLPEKFPGSVHRMTEGPMTTGKSGEPVKTYVSDEIDELGGRRLRIVADVTENPIVDLDDATRQYVGKEVPTGHGTLDPSGFDLKAGRSTLLEGFPEEASGFRKAQELYHFYSAPGDEGAVTVYGGYSGIGDDAVSGSRIKMGGKPTALVTLDTKVSNFARLPTESMDDWLSRVSHASGQTGIAPETLAGRSVERQLVTPASYARGGEQLPGSVFTSKGSIGTFQVVQTPDWLKDVPVFRVLGSRYSNINVVVGEYGPVPGYVAPSTFKALDVGAYNEASVPSRPISVAPMSITPVVVGSLTTRSAPSVPSPSSSTFTTVSSPSATPASIGAKSFAPTSLPKSSPTALPFEMIIPKTSPASKPASSTSSIPVFKAPDISIPKQPSKQSTPLGPLSPSAIWLPSSKPVATAKLTPTTHLPSTSFTPIVKPISIPSLRHDSVPNISPVSPSPRKEYSFPPRQGILPVAPSPRSYDRKSPMSEPSRRASNPVIRLPEDTQKHMHRKETYLGGWFLRRKPVISPEEMWRLRGPKNRRN